MKYHKSISTLTKEMDKHKVGPYVLLIGPDRKISIHECRHL